MNATLPMSDERTFTEANVFDGGLGFFGAYTWKPLPHPMTKKQAEAHGDEQGWCPVEGLR